MERAEKALPGWVARLEQEDQRPGTMVKIDYRKAKTRIMELELEDETE